MYFSLDPQGYFVCDVIEGTPEDNNDQNWTVKPVPQPVGIPRMVGQRLDTGEWVGEWVDEAEEEPPYVPMSVSKAQGKAALIQRGLWQMVLDYVDSIDDPTQKALAEVALHDAQEYRRDSPFLNAAADALGITEDQKDALFVLAAEILL